MPTDRPTPVEILQAVELFLQDKVAPQLEPHSKFHLKVTTNLLRILQREWEQRDQFRGDELARLQQLLDSDSQDLEASNAELCKLIRAGTISLDNKLLKEHLQKTARAKLEIDNPKYLAGR